MPFGIIGRTGPGMRQIEGFGDRSTEKGTFGDEFGARHCNQWRLYGVRVRQPRDAALFRNYFGQTCYYYYYYYSSANTNQYDHYSETACLSVGLSACLYIK